MAAPSVRRLSVLLGTSNSHEALRAGAQIYVNFLSLTWRSGFLQGHISKQSDCVADSALAARGLQDRLQRAEEAAHARSALEIAAARHLAFMELRKELPTAVPTRDISVVWHSDLLRPTVGVIKQHEEAEDAATAWFDHQQHRLLQSGATFEEATGRRRPVTHALRKACTLAAWQHQYDVTAARWRDNEATEYRVAPEQMAVVGPRRLVDVTEQQRRSELAAELADAVASQASFAGRILALGPKVINDEWIGRAVTRYGDFLALARAHPGEMLVPTLDVDLIWCVTTQPLHPVAGSDEGIPCFAQPSSLPRGRHVHMLSPLDYRDDCEAMLGRLLSHDAHTTHRWTSPSSPTHLSTPSRYGTIRTARRTSTGRRPIAGARVQSAGEAWREGIHRTEAPRTPGAARVDGAMQTSMRSSTTHRRRLGRSNTRTTEEAAAAYSMVPPC